MATQSDRVLDQAQTAARRFALERLPIFLRTSSIEVLVGIAVIVLGVLDGGLIGATLVGLGTLLVAWTTATGVASSTTRTTMAAAQAERDALLAARLLELEEQLVAAHGTRDEAVRTALSDQARRSLTVTLAELGVRPEAPPPETPEPGWGQRTGGPPDLTATEPASPAPAAAAPEPVVEPATTRVMAPVPDPKNRAGDDAPTVVRLPGSG